MTTHTCEICMEEYPVDQHTVCLNGHFGGCQKCHMKLVRAKYMNGESAYKDESLNTQKCMMCRRHMNDEQMGVNWGQKLYTLQPIMMYTGFSMEEKWNITLVEVITKYKLMTEQPDDNTDNYFVYTAMFDYGGIKQLVKFMNIQYNDYTSDHERTRTAMKMVQEMGEARGDSGSRILFSAMIDAVSSILAEG